MSNTHTSKNISADEKVDIILEVWEVKFQSISSKLKESISYNTTQLQYIQSKKHHTNQLINMLFQT